MHFITLTSRPNDDGPTDLPHGTRKDLRLIDEALANGDRRALAEAALHIAAQMIEQAPDVSGEEAPLAEAERGALGRIGIDPTDTMSDAEFFKSKPVLEGMTREARMTAEAIPLADAARRMGVSDARLRQRIASGTLMAIHRPHGRGWLVPAFQLTDAGELPHLGRVLQAAGRPVSAQAMDRFFCTPRKDLDGSAPRDWLVAGQDPSVIESILGGL